MQGKTEWPITNLHPYFRPSHLKLVCDSETAILAIPDMKESKGVNSCVHVHLQQPTKERQVRELRLDGRMDGRNGTKFSLVMGGRISFTLKMSMLACATTWMNPEGTTKHEIKLQKDKYDMIFWKLTETRIGVVSARAQGEEYGKSLLDKSRAEPKKEKGSSSGRHGL